MIGRTLGSYEIVARLGAGGMGEVYRSTDTKLKREVALKVLPASVAGDPDRLARFRREAEVLASLNHPNIAAIYGFEDATDTKALVMELVEGPTLADRLAAGALPVDEAVAIARQIADALDAAHERGIVHRDLKPANIKVRPDGAVKVLDFGLAKAAGPSDEAAAVTSNSPTLTTPAMTEAGVVLGTASYMAPEQARGRAVDRRADIWAFGVVLHEMLTGRRLFAGESTIDVLTAVLQHPIDLDTLPAGTTPEIRRLVRRCLQRDPRQRLRDIADARLELEESAQAKEDAVPVARGMPARGARVGLVGWAVGVAGLAAAGTMALSRGAPGVEFIAYQFTTPRPGEGAGPARISPDGRHVVYETGGRLHLRSLDQRDARPLDDTEGAREPFWSPDSRSIGFFAGGELKRVTVAGGPPVVLAPVADGWPAGTWSSNGSILVEVTENPEAEGWYLLAPGGTTLTKVKAFARDRPINPDKAFPWFLPDGDHFLFTHPVGTAPTVQVGSIHSDETRALVSADTRAIFADGHILYVRQGTLFAHPFDPSSLTLTADPRAIVEDVDFFSPTGEMSVTASDTGTLVYRPQVGRSQLRWFDRAGRDLGAVLEPDYYDAVAIASDGRRLALGIRNPRQSTSDLWTVDLDRTVPIRLTSSPRTEMSPRWSPDGNRIVFSTDWEGPPNLYIGDASGGEPKVLVPFDRTQQYAGGWTPDGGQVLYARRSESSGMDIWIVDVASGERQPVLATAFDENSPTVSPNGRWLAYASNASGRPEVYVREYPAGRWQDRVSVDGANGPAWRADSGELVFYELSGALASVSIEGPAGGRPRIGRPTRLFTVDGQRFQSYVPSPDGQRFLLNLAEPGALTPPDAVIVDWRRLIR